jgi:phage tail sheath protein FI
MDYDLVGSAVAGTGLFALDQVEHFDLLYLPQPGRNRDVGPAAILAAELYCRRRSAMLIMDPPSAWQTAAGAVAGVRNAGFASPNMLTYFPRLASRAGEEAAPRVAGGAIAGLICKLDRRHGAWQALDRPELTFSRSLVPAVEVGSDVEAQLVREGINVVAGLPNGQAVLRGSVTLARNSQHSRQFGWLPGRLLSLVITKAIEKATRWAVFEPNEPRLAERIQAQIHAYLSGLADAGAFADDRFVVLCDAGLYADAVDPRRGITILLAFRPAGAQQAISLTLHQTVSGCRVTTTAFAPVHALCA